MVESLAIPDSAPVMVLEGCNFFPGTPLPLHIFETRYRAMLALALEGDRMFCLGSATDGAIEDLPADEAAGIYRYGTLGLVRACVQREDGTSNLILEGLKRVEFCAWLRDEPFRIARLQAVETSVEDEAEVRRQGAKVVALAKVLIERGARKPPDFDLGWSVETEPELVGDFVANYLVNDFESRHRLLGLASLDERLRYLAEVLKGQLGSMGPEGFA